MITAPTTPRFKNIKKSNKEVMFLGLKLEIQKLSVNDVLKVQEYTKELNGSPATETTPAIEADPEANLKGLTNIIKIGCEELSTYDDEDLRAIALDDLNKLADEILKFSGMGAANSK